MENSSRYLRASHSNSSLKQRRNGYEPSDTETDWQESPWRDLQKKDNHLRRDEDVVVVADRPKFSVRSITPPSRSDLSNLDYGFSSPIETLKSSSLGRNKSKSPYKPRRDDDNVVVSPKLGNQDLQRNSNISPFSKSERRKHLSPYKTRKEEPDINEEFIRSSRTQNHKMSRKHFDLEEKKSSLQFLEASRGTEKSTYDRRSVSAPKPRAREKEQQINLGLMARRGDRSGSPLPQKQRETASEINEMVANARVMKGPVHDDLKVEITESISPGDIFFSRNGTALALQRNVEPRNVGYGSSFPSKPKEISKRDPTSHQRSKLNANFNQRTPGVSSSTVASQTNTTSSRRTSSKSNTGSSKMSDGSGPLSGSFRKFTANIQKSQKDTWFGCVRKGPCRTTSKAPEIQEFDEALFIQKAFVDENLRQFWADKHQPASLSGFICHKQQAQLLKQSISHDSCPHILFKGPSGSGKKALTRALLCEIFGDQARNEKRPMQIVVPLTSSPHHVELYLKSESVNVRFALMALVKEMASNHAITPEVSNASCWADYKVIVFYEVEKLAVNVQHMIKWIMDCYMDACKIILCCEDDVDILDSVKSRCKAFTVDAPITHEIMDVLIQIAKKESFDLPMSFAAKIATKSKQNIRKAIMALEACKAHNYPFVDEQPIPVGWEEVLVELSAEILSDPSPERLFFVRANLQKLLLEFVHPKLILQKLVEQFLKGVEASLKRELYYWHAYYDKRLPTGTSALLKLEEFVAKFMSIYRKSLRGRYPYPQ
ncbi:Replication factor C [Macleaya cordata]|uniref:Replication factor C n=1 Tax=Macleaya cordata TaxID=56857 RepID=A0A200Q9E2_MACCD|nr:Replication factor C [Macleaya cordata]